MNAKFLSVNAKDFLKGLIVAIGASIIVSLVNILQTGALPTIPQLKIIGIAGLSAGLSYIGKNFLTNSDDQFLKAEIKKPLEIKS